MAKSEWEKTRDTFDFIEALNGRASTGIGGAFGQQARQGRQWANPSASKVTKGTRVQTGRVSQAETDRASRLISSSPKSDALPYWYQSMVEILTVLALIAGVCFGVWAGWAGIMPEYADMVWWKRIGISAAMFGGIGAVAVQVLSSLLVFSKRHLLPIVLRLAGVAIVLGFIYLAMTGQI